MSVARRCPVTVIIHTLNEELNIGASVASVIDWADQVIVVDSDSTDGTQEIARAGGAELYSRACTRKGLVAQRNWALDTLPIRNKWIFILDGDEIMEPDLAEEVSRIVAQDPSDKDGFWCRFKVYWRERWIRRSSMYPTWSMRLFRHGVVRYEQREANAHPFVKPGREGYLQAHVRNQDRRPFEYWVQRMNDFSTLEAQAYSKVLLGETTRSVIQGRFFGSHAERRRFLKNVYIHLPFKPIVIFLYIYVLRRGFLDGRVGLDFALYKAVSEWMTTVKIKERMAARAAGQSSGSASEPVIRHSTTPVLPDAAETSV